MCCRKLCLGVFWALLGVFSGLATGLAAETAPAGKVKVLYMFNGGHDGKGFIALVGKVLEGTGDFTVTNSQSADDLKAENIGKYDEVLFYGSGGTITDPKQEQGLWNFVQQGGGIVGVHATDANKSSDVYWELLGGRFIGHGSGKYTVHIYDRDHPITAGLGDFDIATRPTPISITRTPACAAWSAWTAAASGRAWPGCSSTARAASSPPDSATTEARGRTRTFSGWWCGPCTGPPAARQGPACRAGG